MKKIIITAALIITSVISYAQKQKVAVLPLDSKGILLDPTQLANLLRMEAEKSELFSVMDRYEVESNLQAKGVKLNNCFGLTCLADAGKALQVDKVLSGSVERYDEKIMVTLRLIDVNKGTLEKTRVDEFLNIQPEIKNMLGASFRNMYELPNDPFQIAKITKENSLESATNNPGSTKLNSSGPRIGLSLVTGQGGRRLSDPKNVGGYDAFPVMTQFGYQFETQYLNSGDFQALFEFIPLVTGLDQGYFIPSLTMLNGLRNNKNGWEFAFGPAFGFVKEASGYFENGTWHLKEDWDRPYSNPNIIEQRIDSRGDVNLTTGFVFAIGKTFRSASLNIPVNFYVIPGRDGARVGLSFGYNTKK